KSVLGEQPQGSIAPLRSPKANHPTASETSLPWICPDITDGVSSRAKQNKNLIIRAIRNHLIGQLTQQIQMKPGWDKTNLKLKLGFQSLEAFLFVEHNPLLYVWTHIDAHAALTRLYSPPSHFPQQVEGF